MWLFQNEFLGLSQFLLRLHDALIVTGRLLTVQQQRVRGSLCPAGETACGGWWWLSGCLDGLDKDIKGKQKAALWRGHRRGQTSLFLIQVGVSVQGYLSWDWGRCRSTGCEFDTDLSSFIICMICIFYFLLLSYYLDCWVLQLCFFHNTPFLS